MIYGVTAFKLKKKVLFEKPQVIVEEIEIDCAQ